MYEYQTNTLVSDKDKKTQQSELYNNKKTSQQVDITPTFVPGGTWQIKIKKNFIIIIIIIINININIIRILSKSIIIPIINIIQLKINVLGSVKRNFTLNVKIYKKLAALKPGVH